MQRSFPNGAIVLGGEVNGIAVMRSLGRLGVRCGAVFAGQRANHARHSRYLVESQAAPADAEDEELISKLDSVASRLGGAPCVIFPTTDRFSQLLSTNQETLSRRYLICNPQRSLCESFLDKWQTAELCRSNGVLIPETACPQTREELVRIAGEITYPVIVKPRYTFGTGFPGKNAVFENENGLLRFLDGSALLGRCVIQQIISSGDGDILVTATYSGSSGTVEAIYSGRKIRQYLPDYGATCFGISERQPALEESSRTFLNNIRYEGFAALEFARSRDDGKAYFLELNTRTYYHNQLFADAGVDLTQVGFLSAVGLDPRAVLGPLTQRDNIVWLDFRRDFQSMRIKRRQNRISIASWLSSIVNARSFAYWDPRDPMPFLHACAYRCKELSRHILARKSRRTSD